MTAPVPSLSGAEWLATRAVRRIFAALEAEGDSARIIGGAVRSALAGLPVGDIDFATTATPDRVVARAAAAGIKAVPTGIEHGTLTLVADGVGYQVTTLREDVATDGRHAVVRFGRDWDADARRRDFTVNSLSVDADGTVHDPLGGYDDILARRVRFIGDPGERIAEDRLRILRFFRFNAEFGAGDFDPDGLAAAIRARQGLRLLSAERVGQEMRRLILASRAAEAIAIMQDCGILLIALGGVAYVGPFARFLAFERTVGAAPSAALRLAAAACRVEEDVARLTGRLRLANAERDLMLGAVVAARRLPSAADERQARRLLYDVGDDVFRAAASLAFVWTGRAEDEAAWAELYRLPDRWRAPRFPLSGGDALGAGATRGPAIGAVLKSLEAWWIERDFAPDEAALRNRLQQMVAGAQ
jgi:tRNA nucleotidyltransferase/poly(A) polymerase